MSMRILFFIIMLFLTGYIYAQDLKSGGILKPEQEVMDIRHYKLELEVDPSSQSIDGNTVITLITSEPVKLLLFDLVNLLEVRKVWVNGKEETFIH